MKMAAVVVVVLAVVGSSAACAQALCTKVNASETTCKLTTSEKAWYTITAVATHTGGKNGPSASLEVTVEGKSCANEKLSWDNGTALQTVHCVAELASNTTYTIKAKSSNHDAKAAGIDVSAGQSKPVRF